MAVKIVTGLGVNPQNAFTCLLVFGKRQIIIGIPNGHSALWKRPRENVEYLLSHKTGHQHKRA